MLALWIFNLSKIHTFNIAMLFVCLSAAFKFLNRVTDCYKSIVNFMMTLGAPRSLKFYLQIIHNANVWGVRHTVYCAYSVSYYIMDGCKNYTVFIVIEREMARWRLCISSVEFSVTKTTEGLERAREM